MAKLTDKLKGCRVGKPSGPVWEGPEVGGVTFSLLSRFLVCRERFRAVVVEGLKPQDTFNHRTEFGNMWHLCEENHAAGKEWRGPLWDYAYGLCNKYFTCQSEIQNWAEICEAEFPEYVAYWSSHDTKEVKTPLLQEHVFDIPYKLPSGKVVRLRGKWDSVHLVGGKLELQENKTKSDINESQVRRQLRFDLQTMMYLTAMQLDPHPLLKGKPVGRVLYNVVKRPRHYRGKKETQGEFLGRLRGIIADSPGDFFMRWEIAVTPGDVENFKRKCLNPVLEQLCHWWDCVTYAQGDSEYGQYSLWADWESGHYQHPFGVYNVLDEGGSSDLDEYLATGSEVGLRRVTNLFPELTGG